MIESTRQADITDAAEIARIIENVELFSDDEAAGFIGMLPDLLADEDHVWLVVSDGVQLIGAAYMSLDGMSQDVWNLWFIGVSPDRQGTGAGSALLRAAEKQARDADARLLMVETSGVDGFDATRAFYEKNGYATVARIPDYYAPGDDKVIFTTSLAVA